MKYTLFKSDIVISILAIVLAMISITVGASFAKSMFSYIKPESVTFLRLTLSAVILFFALRVWEAKLTKKNIGSVCLYGCTIAGMNLFFYMSIKTIPIGVALAIELIGPLFVSIVFSQKRSDLIWAALAALGIYLLIPISTSASELDPIGIAYAGIAATFWGAYIIFGKKAGLQHGAKAPALGLVVASILMLPIGIETLSLSSLSIDLVLLMVVVAILSSLIPLVLEMKALRHLPTKTYGVLTSGEPVIGTIASFFILGEKLAAIQTIGITIIVFASICSVLSPSVEKRLTIE
jgi:inner membrane transporter RhtA